MKRLSKFLPYLSVVLLLPLVTVPVPGEFHPASEAGAYFQAQSFVSHGLHSYTTQVYAESGAGLHLYSLLASPLVGLGYVNAGRVVSVLATLLTMICLSKLSLRFSGRLASVVAPVMLVANPYYYPFAWSTRPEAVSVALVSAAVLSIVTHYDTGGTRWFVLSVGVSCLAVFNHSWEAVVLLPVAAVLVLASDLNKSLIAAFSVVFSVGAVLVVQSLEPSPSLASDYAVVYTGLAPFVNGKFFKYVTLGVAHIFRQSPTSLWDLYLYGHGLQLSAGLVALILLTTTLRRELSLPVVVLWTWTIAGFAIPVLLPGGAFHQYYLWGLVPPVTLCAAGGTQRLAETLLGREVVPSVDTETVSLALVSLLLVTVAVQTGVVATGVETAGGKQYVSTDNRPSDVDLSEAIKAGYEIRQGYDDVHVSGLNFVGEWDRARPSRAGIMHVLIYGGVSTDGVGYRELRRTFRDGDAHADSCRVAVVMDENGSVSVIDCGSPNSSQNRLKGPQGKLVTRARTTAVSSLARR